MAEVAAAVDVAAVGFKEVKKLEGVATVGAALVEVKVDTESKDKESSSFEPSFSDL